MPVIHTPQMHSSLSYSSMLSDAILLEKYLDARQATWVKGMLITKALNMPGRNLLRAARWLKQTRLVLIHDPRQLGRECHLMILPKRKKAIPSHWKMSRQHEVVLFILEYMPGQTTTRRCLAQEVARTLWITVDAACSLLDELYCAGKLDYAPIAAAAVVSLPEARSSQKLQHGFSC